MRTKVNVKTRLCLFLLPLLLLRCEPDLHDNFAEIEHPATRPMEISLDAYTEGDMIVIYKEYTTINYSANTFGKDVSTVKFTLNEQSWEELSNRKGRISTDPYSLPNGTDKLTCEIYSKSDNGSIIDQLYQEYYVGTKEWTINVAYESEMPAVQEIRTRVNEEGFLELSWDKPLYQRLKFKKYLCTYDEGSMYIKHLSPDFEITQTTTCQGFGETNRLYKVAFVPHNSSQLLLYAGESHGTATATLRRIEGLSILQTYPRDVLLEERTESQCRHHHLL